MISLIIPAYHVSEELEAMTRRCLDSLKGRPDEVILEIDKKGDGYTKTTNKGLQKAKGDILIVGNNDLTFHDGWLEELLFPLQLGYDLSTIWTSDQDYNLEDRIENEAKFGSLFAMTRKLYEDVGDLDERFKGYFVDTDYRRRVLENGYRIGKNLSAVVEHQAKATYSLVDPDDFEFQRARVLFEIKWGYLE